MTRSEDGLHKIGVIQFSRLGDILMSLPLLEALRRIHRTADIRFFINSAFEGILPPSNCFELVPVDFPGMFGGSDRPASVGEMIKTLKTHLGEDMTAGFDLVVNLSGLKIAAIFNAAMHTKHRRGPLFSEDGTIVNADAQLALFTEHRTGRKLNWLHQVEIYSAVAEGFIPPPLHHTRKYLYGDNCQSFMGGRLVAEEYILISPGASVPQKQIDKRILKSVVDGILDHTGYRVVLCGAENERNAGKEIRAIDAGRITDFTGQTRLDQLYSLIYHSDCLISNDSGPMHMAALLDRRNIVFSTGSAFFPETIGYNDNVMVLSPADDCYPCPWIGYPCTRASGCHSRFDVHGLLQLILDYIKKGTACFHGICDEADGSITGANVVHRTAIGPQGLLLMPFGQQELDGPGLVALIYQSYWKEKLFGWDAGEILRSTLNRYELADGSLADHLEGPLGQIEELTARMERLLSCFSELNEDQDGHLMDQISGGIDHILQSSQEETFLSPLLHYHSIRYHSAIAGDMSALLGEYHRNTRDLANALRRVKDLILLTGSEYPLRPAGP